MTAAATEPDGVGPLEEGDPAHDSRAFRRALGQFATGVTVMTARAGGRLAGVTANSFASVSLDPPLVLWSNTRKSHSRPVFSEASHFAVNVLAADQIALSTRFSRQGTDKFASIAWREGAGGAPLLPGVAARFECRREAEHDGGDHVVMIGRVERFARFDRPILIFAQGRYGLALDHPEIAQRPEAASADPHPLDDFLIPLLLRAYGHLSSAFDMHREAEGLTVEQSRVLACLAAHPSPSVETVARTTFLGIAAAEDAIASLVSMGYAAPAPPNAIVITAQGRAKLRSIFSRARAFETEQLAGLAPGDVEAARRVLLKLAGSTPRTG